MGVSFAVSEWSILSWKCNRCVVLWHNPLLWLEKLVASCLNACLRCIVKFFYSQYSDIFSTRESCSREWEIISRSQYNLRKICKRCPCRLACIPILLCLFPIQAFNFPHIFPPKLDGWIILSACCLTFLCLCSSCSSPDSFYHGSLPLHVTEELTVLFKGTFSSVPLWHLQLARLVGYAQVSSLSVFISAEGLVMRAPSVLIPSMHTKFLGSLMIAAGAWVCLAKWRTE